jgi:hypothetical protein
VAPADAGMTPFSAVFLIASAIVILGGWPILVIIATSENPATRRLWFTIEFAGAWSLALTVAAIALVVAILALAQCHVVPPTGPIRPLSVGAIGTCTPIVTVLALAALSFVGASRRRYVAAREAGTKELNWAVERFCYAGGGASVALWLLAIWSATSKTWTCGPP